jgi:hypothetical protein
MSIEKSLVPDECYPVLVEGLRNVRILPNDSITFSSLAAEAPLPVHVFGADQALVGDLNDPPALYRYFFKVDGKSMLADLDAEPDGKISLNSFLEGEGAEMFDPVFRAVSEFAKTADDRFSMSVIEVPALYETALWLRGQKADFAFEVVRGGELGQRAPVSFTKYVADLATAASQSYIFANTTRPSDAPKNDGPGK